MFSANISGIIKRFIAEDDKRTTVVLEVRKQFIKENDTPNQYPVVTIFGNDSKYVQKYAGVGDWIECVNCELNIYYNEDKDMDQTSFTAGRINLLPASVRDGVDHEEEPEPEQKPKRGSRSASTKTETKTRTKGGSRAGRGSR